jgi:hypothetical protein
VSTAEAWVLRVHVATGTVAVLAGLAAMVTAKGGRRHRRAGRWFVASMAVVVATSLLLLALSPTSFRVFLGLVAVFSGYLAFSGYRALSRAGPADGTAPVDRAAAVAVVAASLGLGGWGLARLVDGAAFGVAPVAFGGIGLAFGAADLRAFRRGGRRGPRRVTHLQRMVAAFVATVSAVSAVNLTGTLGVLAWLWPAAVFTPLIAHWSRTYGSE